VNQPLHLHDDIPPALHPTDAGSLVTLRSEDLFDDGAVPPPVSHLDARPAAEPPSGR
jgi:hypothetical protein